MQQLSANLCAIPLAEHVYRKNGITRIGGAPRYHTAFIASPSCLRGTLSWPSIADVMNGELTLDDLLNDAILVVAHPDDGKR